MRQALSRPGLPQLLLSIPAPFWYSWLMQLQILLPCAACLAAVLLSSSPAAGASVGTGPSFKGPVGLQLYSLRDQFKKDVSGTLDEVKKFGFKYAEVAGTYGLTAEQFTAQLAARGIKPIGAHFDYDRYRTDPEGVALEAKSLGLQYAGCAWIPHQGDFDEKTCREAAAVFNHAGEVMARHGLKFFYHTHGYEFQPYGQALILALFWLAGQRSSEIRGVLHFFALFLLTLTSRLSI